MRFVAKFSGDLAKHDWVMAIYRFSKWLLSAIFDFQKCECFTVRRVKMPNLHSHAKFHLSRSNFSSKF